jgi:hypothetical protein
MVNHRRDLVVSTCFISIFEEKFFEIFSENFLEVHCPKDGPDRPITVSLFVGTLFSGLFFDKYTKEGTGVNARQQRRVYTKMPLKAFKYNLKHCR